VKESVCIPVEDLSRVRGLPADSPERRHVADCPRCRARMLALAEFERPTLVLPREADEAGAGERLDAFIDRLGGGAAKPAPRPPMPWWQRLFEPAMRPALAALVVVIAAGSFWAVTRPLHRQELRGDAESAPALAAAVATPDGWELAWAATGGADAYEVLFFGADLRESARVSGLHETHLLLRREALPAGVEPGKPCFWQVVALRAGDPLARSRTTPLRLR
jgi:hypothetical protein